MISNRGFVTSTLGAAALAGPLAMAGAGQTSASSSHVLLISIDGMHALDFHNCAFGNTCPNLAALASNGVHYTRTSTSKPAKSWP